ESPVPVLQHRFDRQNESGLEHEVPPEQRGTQRVRNARLLVERDPDPVSAVALDDPKSSFLSHRFDPTSDVRKPSTRPALLNAAVEGLGSRLQERARSAAHVTD